MGMYFSVNGGGTKVNLSSVLHSALEMTSGENTLAKGNDTTCKLFITLQINQNNIMTTMALKEIEEWAKQCNQEKDSYKEVAVEQTYASLFHRKVIFPDARIVSFQETFLTDNKKFMEVSLEIEQKESKQDAIRILYI